MFYFLLAKPQWEDVWQEKGFNLTEHFDRLGREFKVLYEKLKNNKNIEFVFSAEQQKYFNETLGTLFNTYTKMQGEDFTATSFRLGLITFRLAMIISIFRYIEKDMPSVIQCQDSDFKIAIDMLKVLNVHSSLAFEKLSKRKGYKNNKERFLAALPKHFNRQNYLDVASMLKINHKTVEGYITEFIKNGLIIRPIHDSYTKIQDIQD